MLKYLNYYLLQWFFIRLARVEDVDTGEVYGWAIAKAMPLSGYNGRPWRRWGSNKYLFYWGKSYK